MRRVVFSVAALERVAAAAVGARVTSIEKIDEHVNRVLLLKFDNGTEAVVKIPTAVSGPPGLTTASEVATMDFLRRLHIPVPRVLAWNSRPESSDVGAEYIIMEMAKGHRISDVRRLGELVEPLSKVLKPLVDLQFKYHGSIYYKNDIPPESTSYSDFLLNPPPEIDLSQFVIGPIAHRDWWEGDRARQDTVHGPCECTGCLPISHLMCACLIGDSAYQYSFDIAHREQVWLKTAVKPSLRDNCLCVLPGQGNVEDHVIGPKGGSEPWIWYLLQDSEDRRMARGRI